jgi:hypothetical protein
VGGAAVEVGWRRRRRSGVASRCQSKAHPHGRSSHDRGLSREHSGRSCPSGQRSRVGGHAKARCDGGCGGPGIGGSGGLCARIGRVRRGGGGPGVVVRCARIRRGVLRACVRACRSHVRGQVDSCAAGRSGNGGGRARDLRPFRGGEGRGGKEWRYEVGGEEVAGRPWLPAAARQAVAAAPGWAGRS